MKKVILLLMFLPYLANGQIVENFESASLSEWVQSTGNRWDPDTTRAISGRYSLHHIYDNASAGIDCIGIPLEKLHPDEGNVKWRFSLRHGYDPSASNKWCVYLLSDEDPAAVATGVQTNGFAVGVNLTGYDDSVRLWKMKSGSPLVIATCPVNWQNDIGISDAATLEIVRSQSGSWNIKVYDVHLILKGEASGFDSELFRSSSFIISYSYTATRDRLLWFDDLEIDGVFHDDTQAPRLLSCNLSGISSLDLIFDEEPSADFTDLSDFSIEGSNNVPASISKIGSRKYRLTFKNILENKTKSTLIIKQVCDNTRNCADDLKAEFFPVRPDPGDIIISEIMADPSPPVLLPEKEYLEISNRTEYTFNLKKWKLSTEAQGTVFPDVNIVPHGRMVLCQQSDTGLFKKYGQTCGIKSFPSLTDEGRMLYISDSLGNLIHGLVYSSGWYGSKLKQTGGWSLEMEDENYPFYTGSNWEASSSLSGGTPGKANSVSAGNPDHIFYGIVNVYPVDSVTILISFPETVFGLAGEGSCIYIGSQKASSVVAADPLLMSFIVRSPFQFLEGNIYTVSTDPGLTDFAGNCIQRNSFRFGLPLNPDRGDIVFNELLFNPIQDDPDYIEFYNCSGKVFDASLFYLASISVETGDTSEIRPVSESRRCINPATYFTITGNRQAIISRYPSSDPDNIFDVVSMPSMPGNCGHLLLMNRALKIIDEVIYTEKMHNPLLSGTEGISLEKIRPQLSSAQSSSWLSASEGSGWGTPGAENSVYCSVPVSDDQVVLSSQKISPDNDGIDDALVVDIKSPDNGNVVNITIFNETGGFVRKLCENLFAESRVSVGWDGTAGDGSLVPAGIYVLLVEMYNDKGKMKSWKKVCAVIRD